MDWIGIRARPFAHMNVMRVCVCVVGFYWFIEHNLLNYYDDWARLSDTFGNSRCNGLFLGVSYAPLSVRNDSSADRDDDHDDDDDSNDSLWLRRGCYCRALVA